MGTGCSTCRFCCPRCKKAVRDAKFLHLGSRNLNVEPPFSPVGSRVAKPECRTTIFTSRCYFTTEVFASRVAKPECRTTIFTDRPDRLLFYYFTNFISIRFQAEVFASRVAKPECRITIFTSRPAGFASRVAKPECRTTIFTSRPDRLLFYYFTNFISVRFQAEVFASRVAKPECRTTIFTGRPAVFASRVAKPECRTTIFTSRPDRLLFYYFTISFPFGSRQRFLHLG